jgi:hypothetical protein
MLAKRLVALMLCGAAIGAALSLTLAAATAPADATALPSTSTAVKKALKYLKSRQTRSGGFSAKGMSQSAATPWVVMAVRAAGQDPAKWRRAGGKTPIQYMQGLDIERLAQGTTPRNPAATYSKYILAYKAARKTSLTRRAGRKRIDLVVKLLTYQDPASGRFTTTAGGKGSYAAINTTTYAVLALKAAGRASAARARAVRWLRTQAHSSGGFSWNPGGSPDVDSTGAAVQALRAGGVSSSSGVIRSALKFMKAKQQRDGGFAYDFGGSVLESSALAIQGIVAAGQDPAGAAWRRGGKSPVYYLHTMQARNGSFYHLGRISATPLLATSYAVMGLKKRKLPL